MMAEYGHRSFGSMFTVISWMAGKGFPETIAVSVLGGGSRSGSFRHVMGPEPRRVIPLVAWAPTTRPRRTSATGLQRVCCFPVLIHPPQRSWEPDGKAILSGELCVFLVSELLISVFVGHPGYRGDVLVADIGVQPGY